MLLQIERIEQWIPHYHQSIDQIRPGILFDPSDHNEQLVFSVLWLNNNPNRQSVFLQIFIAPILVYMNSLSKTLYYYLSIYSTLNNFSPRSMESWVITVTAWKTAECSPQPCQNTCSKHPNCVSRLLAVSCHDPTILWRSAPSLLFVKPPGVLACSGSSPWYQSSASIHSSASK